MKKKSTSFPGKEVCGILFPRTSWPSAKNRFHRSFLYFCGFSLRSHHVAWHRIWSSDLAVLTCPHRRCLLLPLFHKWERNSCLSCHNYRETQQRLLFCRFLLFASFQYYHVSPLKKKTTKKKWSKAGAKSDAALYSGPDNAATPSWLCDASAF